MTNFITPSTIARLANRSVDIVRIAIRSGRLRPDALTERRGALFLPETAERWIRERQAGNNHHSAPAA